MVTVHEAMAIILDHVRDYGTEEIPLGQSGGRVLREPITADRDFPPFDRVAMDGVALRYHDFQQGVRDYKVVGVAAAGSPLSTVTESQTAMEVMTGCIRPEGTDVVVPYEKIKITDGIVRIQTEDVRLGQNIHDQGLDRKRGEEIISAGKILSAAEIGVCASVGKTHVKVSCNPKIIILSTGDELVPIGATPLPHQIRNSNAHTIRAVLSTYGIHADIGHLSDHYETITKELQEIIEGYDVLILSGGVSKGKFDYLPQAIEQMGIKKHFHKVFQRPGKPFWFGSNEKVVLFAFPGNPVASFVCMHRYFRPWLEGSIKQTTPATPKGILTEDVHFKKDLTYFLEVQLNYASDGTIRAIPKRGKGSGDLANLVEVDAFLELPQGQDTFHKGEAYPLWIHRR